MIKKIYLILVVLSLSFQINAKCDWSTIKTTDQGYLYSKECHIEVGKIVEEVELRKKQVEELNKTITFKDLAMTKADERIVLWRDTSFELEERIVKQRKWSAYNDYLWFGGGIAVTILSGWAMGQVSK